MSEPPVDLSYEPFSRAPEYVAEARAFVAAMRPDRAGVVLDLACGTGTLTDLMLERVATGAWPAGPDGCRMTAIDLSRESLELAREHLARRWPEARVTYVEGSIDRLPAGAASVDVAVLGNAIHLFPDKDALIREVARVLRPGGLFACNTSFFAGTFVPGTEGFYTDWLKHALVRVRERGGKRRRGGARAAFTVRWLTEDEYAAALTRHGMRVLHMTRQIVPLTQRSLEDVGAYSGLAAVLLDGYPTHLASEALVHAAAPAFTRAGTDVIPRYWLDIIAARDRAAP